MVRTLLSTTMCGEVCPRQLAAWGVFQLVNGGMRNEGEASRTESARKYIIVLICRRSRLEVFDLVKLRLIWDWYFHWTNPADIPRIAAA